MNIIELGKSIYKNEDLFPSDYFKSKQIHENIGDNPSHFEILKLLGKGAFGKVYKVQSKKNKQIYAMKIFEKNINIIKSNLKIKKLLHPNIINIYTHFEYNNKLYVIMEYMNNGNLKDYIEMNKPNNKINNALDENQILFIMLQTLWPLYFIHGSGYILRNIKPENILIDENMQIKYGEFLSTIVPIRDIQLKNNNMEHPYEKESNDKSVEPIWKRTKKYISKKQLTGAQGDVYSLGLVLKELLSFDYLNKEMKKIIRDMCDEYSEYQESIDNLFITITTIYTRQQKNSCIDAVILCMKSFNDFSQLIMGNKHTTNMVIDKLIQVLKLINDKNGNFYNWNYCINAVRLALNQEIPSLEEIEEIDPNEVYLYLINIIINEAKKNYFKENHNNICEFDLITNKEEQKEEAKINELSNMKYIIENNNVFDCPIIKNISGLMRVKLTCKKCKHFKYQFSNYTLLEVNPRQFLKDGEESTKKIDLEDLLKKPIALYTNIVQCNQCFQKTEHTCTKEIYSLPDSLAISIKENFLDDNNNINIKDQIELDLDQSQNNNKKIYELVALLKLSRKNNNLLYYSFSKFNNKWFLSQRYKGIELIEMNEYHRRSRNVRMVFYHAIADK